MFSFGSCFFSTSVSSGAPNRCSVSVVKQNKHRVTVSNININFVTENVECTYFKRPSGLRKLINELNLIQLQINRERFGGGNVEKVS